MKINIGTMYYEGTEKQLTDLISYCLENKLNKFDTSTNYSTQKDLGSALNRFRREDYFLSTKVYVPHEEQTARGVLPSLKKEHVDESIELSLQKLKVDYFDLLYMHRYDENVELEDLVETLLPYLGREVRQIGTSCWPNEKVLELNNLLIAKNFASGVSAIQNPYNLFNRKPETYLNDLRTNKIKLVGYSPLARGDLTGKYIFNQGSAGRAFRDELKETMIFHTDENKELLKDIVDELKILDANDFLAYVLNSYIHILSDMEIVVGVRENSQIKTILHSMNQKVEEESLLKFIQYFDLFLEKGI